MTRPNCDFDAVIIGGGFYGLCLALFLKSVAKRVLVVEAQHAPFENASRINQARIHTGFHYPRSFTTALRSKLLQERFVRDFRDAVHDDFDMVYAIAERRSKVTASRFRRMFEALDAPFSAAPPSVSALFDKQLISAAFVCREFAFNYQILRDMLLSRLDRHDIALRLNAKAVGIISLPEGALVQLSNGEEITAGTVFNVTYANINHLLHRSGLQCLDLKHELTEIALVVPPPELTKMAVTVMDGPFFSSMPYPSTDLYSLTHVRYTPHFSWLAPETDRSAYETAEAMPHETRWRHMVQDGQRYMPCLERVEYQRSLFEVKTIMVKNERDDGRPILLHRHKDAPNLISVMGAKIDNIYDLFDALPQFSPQWRGAHTGLLLNVDGAAP